MCKGFWPFHKWKYFTEGPSFGGAYEYKTNKRRQCQKCDKKQEYHEATCHLMDSFPASWVDMK